MQPAHETAPSAPFLFFFSLIIISVFFYIISLTKSRSIHCLRYIMSGMSEACFGWCKIFSDRSFPFSLTFACYNLTIQHLKHILVSENLEAGIQGKKIDISPPAIQQTGTWTKRCHIHSLSALTNCSCTSGQKSSISVFTHHAAFTHVVSFLSCVNHFSPCEVKLPLNFLLDFLATKKPSVKCPMRQKHYYYWTVVTAVIY